VNAKTGPSASARGPQDGAARPRKFEWNAIDHEMRFVGLTGSTSRWRCVCRWETAVDCLGQEDGGEYRAIRAHQAAMGYTTAKKRRPPVSQHRSDISDESPREPTVVFRANRIACPMCGARPHAKQFDAHLRSSHSELIHKGKLEQVARLARERHEEASRDATRQVAGPRTISSSVKRAPHVPAPAPFVNRRARRGGQSP
jgi:hypothetical protein